MTESEQAIVRILERLAALYEEAETTIDAITDPEQAFAVATEFADKARTMHAEAEAKFKEVRGRQVRRIRDANALALRPLADRISISKSLAGQLMKAAEAKKEAQP